MPMGKIGESVQYNTENQDDKIRNERCSPEAQTPVLLFKQVVGH